MLVEDNLDDVELTLRAFRKKSITNPVVVASNGLEALDYLFGKGAHSGRDTSVQPGLVLLDIKLPKMDGMEVLRQIRADTRTRLLQVVMLSSSREEKDILNSYNLGANSYIRKPVSFEHFVEIAGHLGCYWLSLNEPPRQSGGDRNDLSA